MSASGNKIVAPVTPTTRYREESARIEAEFFTTGDGPGTARARAALVDRVILQVYADCISPVPAGPADFCLVGLGGYGREELFPHSDIDLLLLFRRRVGQAVSRDRMGAFLRQLWDLKLELGHSTRLLNECGRFHPENLEFNIALLDARYLAGDATLYTQLVKEAIPRLARRDGLKLLGSLTQATRERHQIYEDTIYHLEPNVKSSPGGLRDFQVACWSAQILHLEKRGTLHSGPELATRKLDAPLSARQFLFDIRTHLHYLNGQDQNTLTYQRQEQMAGLSQTGSRPPEDWMRDYFRQARVVSALLQSWTDKTAIAHASLLSRFRTRKSQIHDGHFRITQGKIDWKDSASLSSQRLLELFQVIARHGAGLRAETERRIRDHLPALAKSVPDLWAHLWQILTAPFAYDALGAMHQTGVLTTLFPEFKAIDCLVIRDFYHRYTVDEHSLLTIKHLHELRSGPKNQNRRDAVAEGDGTHSRWMPNFGEILAELERPEILFFVLLFHDIGKGTQPDGHVAAGLRIIEPIMSRLRMEEEEKIQVRFLIANHLEMSATLMRRDFHRGEVVRQFADRVATVDRLKMLTLLTYVDIQSVNPAALTSWKRDLLWQLYAATYNELTHTVDDDRFHSAGVHPQMQTVVASLAGKAEPASLQAFLEGFPRHYLRTHSAEEILKHFQLSSDLSHRRVESVLEKKGGWYSLVVLTADRPSLFTQITGLLAAFGMNILKADAFANRRGMILDSFVFDDPHRNFELNPSEKDRFQETLRLVIAGKREVSPLIAGRRESPARKKYKTHIPTQILFDNEISTRATLLEIYTADRPALLHDIGRTLSQLECNIEVALIDTEGGKAIDVFYLTRQNQKLDSPTEQRVRAGLEKLLA